MAKRVFKTTKKVSGGRVTYRPWKEWETGDILIGTYQGSKTDNYDKPNWLIKVEDAQFMDTKLAKKLIGQVIGLNSAGQLDKGMKDLEEGDMIQVTYNGTSVIEKGKYKGKDAHQIELDLVEEDNGDLAEDDDDADIDEEDDDADDGDDEGDDL